jgi:RNA polymerase sigma-70 factor (ECF subfamily)
VAVAAGPDDERDLLARLRAGDAGAFRDVVRHHHPAMVRVAEGYVRSRAVAEEVVQDTWLAVVRGLDGFEGRASLRTWIFTILVRQAQARGGREQRTEPSADPTGEAALGATPSVPPSRFTGPPGHGAWAQPVARWHDDPAVAQESAEALEAVAATLRQMPLQRRQVMVLRDLEGWTSQEVCDVLGISEGNQRVLLHRARVQVRAGLEARGWGS